MERAKDTLPADSQPGVVYAIGCAYCKEIYVKETARTVKERLKEHKCHTRMGQSELSAIAHHVQETQHQIHWKTRIIAKERNTTARKFEKRTSSEGSMPKKREQ